MSDLKYIVSCLAGFGYGLLFGCCPVIGSFFGYIGWQKSLASELFGIEWYFSINITLISVDLFPKTGVGSIWHLPFQVRFSTSFMVRTIAISFVKEVGRIYDSHSNRAFGRCQQGRDCYVSAFLLTLFAASIALMFSLHLHYRQIRIHNVSSYPDWSFLVLAFGDWDGQYEID